MLRLCRFMWERPGSGAHKLSIALRPKLWERKSELWDHAVTILGVRVHHVWGGGGRFV